MKHKDFEIGKEFTYGDNEYRCTDKGTRVIIAIKVNEIEVGGSLPLRRLNKAEANGEGWFNGPPYAVLERVFDEYDMEGCE